MAQRMKFNLLDIVTIFIIIGSATTRYITGKILTEKGIETFYSNPTALFIYDISWMVFTALFTGYIIYKFIRKK